MANTWATQRSGDWSVDASNAASPWNGGSNPASGVPADTDLVTVAVTHAVAFDVNQSGFAAGLGKLEINGTLTCKTSGGPYYLKMAANITGSGTLAAGTSKAVPLPYATKFTIYFNGAFGINSANLTLAIYCAEPTNRWVRLSAAEAAGQTELSVDTDVTADLWSAGDTIYVCNINNARQVEVRTIAAGGIAAGAITVTAGLTAAKLQGSYIVLANRNITINTVGNAVALNNYAKSSVYSEITATGTSYLFTGRLNSTIGGVVHRNATTDVCSGGLFVSDDLVSASGGTFATLSTIFGKINIFGGGAIGTSFVSFRGKILAAGCTGSINGADLYDSQFIGNQLFISYGTVKLRNTLISVGTENTGYNTDAMNLTQYSESLDHNQTPGAFKSWTRGGVTSSQAVVVPPGFAQANQTVLESASYPGFWQRDIMIPKGQKTKITVFLRKSATMAVLPKAELFKKGNEPLLDATVVTNTFTMTDSVDTWEQYTWTITGGTYNEVYTLRFTGQNATGNMFAEAKVEAPVQRKVLVTL